MKTTFICTQAVGGAAVLTLVYPAERPEGEPGLFTGNPVGKLEFLGLNEEAAAQFAKDQEYTVDIVAVAKPDQELPGEPKPEPHKATAAAARAAERAAVKADDDEDDDADTRAKRRK